MTRGPTTSNREKSATLSKNYEDSPTENDKDFEDTKPQSKKEASKTGDALGVESQPGVTKSFGTTSITHQLIKDSLSYTSISREEIMVIKEKIRLCP